MITVAERAANGKTFRMDTAANVEYYLITREGEGMGVSE